MIDILIVLGLFLVIAIPLGKYLYHITAKEKTFADPLFDRVDRFLFRLCGIKDEAMNWKQIAGALLLVNATMMILGFLILKVQEVLPFNPNGSTSMEGSLAFNTVISFMTNTNLQHYAGESALSNLSQMLVIVFLMFTSAASGLAVAMATMRGFSGKFSSLGNFYEDVIRILTRVLLPLSLLIGVILVSQGVIQNFSPTLTIQTLEGAYQNIAMGPVAALEAIKNLGTNGGGFFAANAAHPFENPSVVTNIIEMVSMMAIPGACVVAFGWMVRKNKRESWLKNQATVLFAVMGVLLIFSIVLISWSERSANPLTQGLNIQQAIGNMEGKEIRFGITHSSLFAAITTAFTTGAVNTMHDSLMPLSGLSTLLNMMLNLVFGGKGVGLINMLLYVLLTVFICGLMVGRTPEYLGKKIEAKETKLTALAIIIHPLLILAGTALAVVLSVGLSGISNPGSHGLSQILYEFASSAANNGSGFEGLIDNTAFWNIATGVVMVGGRYISIVIALAIAGSLSKKPVVSESIGTLQTNTMTFGGSLLMIIVIIAALTFLPVLVLGPISEHLMLFR